MKANPFDSNKANSSRLHLTLVLSLAMPLLTNAGSLYWGADASGGSGTWDANTTTNWFDGATAVVWPAAPGSGDDDAIFSNTGGTVSIAPGGVIANDLSFYADGYVLQDGTLTLDGSLANPIIMMGAGVNTTIHSVIAGTNGFIKYDAGKLTLTGNNTFSGNIYLGPIAAGGLPCGTVQITQAGALGVLGNNVQTDGATNQVISIRTDNTLLELDGAGGDITLPDYLVFLTSGPNGVVRNVAGNNTLNSAFFLTTGVGDSGVISDGGSLTLAGPIHVGSSARKMILMGTNSAVNTVSGVISNAANGAATGLQKRGANIWQITSSNSYSGGAVLGVNLGTGPTYISDGILRLANNDAAGTGSITVNGGYQAGRLELTGNLTITNAVNLYGRQGFTYPALRNLAGTNTMSGDFNVVANGARLNIESAAGLFTISGNPMTGASGRTLTLRGAGGGNFAKSATTNVVGSVNKLDAGTWLLSGTNTYTGATTISAGRLQFATPLALYSNTPASWTAANLIVETNATAAFNVGGTNEFTSASIATLSALGNATGGFKWGSFLGLDTANAPGDFVCGVNLANPNAGANKLGLTKFGTNRLTLSGTNTFTGNVTISAGSLRITNPKALDTITSRYLFATANAPLELDGTNGDLVLSSNNSLQTSGAVVNNLAGNNTLLGPIFMTTGVGGTTVTSTGGTLTLAGVINSSGVRPLTLAGASTGTNTISGSIQDGTTPGSPNPVTKTGTGTWTLAGTNTYTGATTVSQGTLRVTGSLSNSPVTVAAAATLAGNGIINGPVVIAGGTLTPGVSTNLSEVLTINHDLTLAGTTLIQIGKSGSTPVHDSVVGVANLNYGGTLIATNATGATFVAGDTFLLFPAAGSPTGNFTNVVVQPASVGLKAEFNPATGTLSFRRAAPPTLNCTVAGGGLQFSWEGSARLQAQTNALSVGLGTNWGDYPGGSFSPVSVPVNSAWDSVYFRLVVP